jgi:HPt (histidine-containing phosphotransfer) domain-containing protein
MSAISPQTVDLAHLARYTGGERALDSEVLKLFARQSAELVAELQVVLAAHDRKRWGDVLHSLKGAARAVGAFSLADAAAEGEPLDPAAETAKALAALAVLKERAGAVNAFITAYLEG